MLKIINKLNQQEENPITICKMLFKELDISHTEPFLKKTLQLHPDYPSLLALKDVMEDYSLESIAIKRNDLKFEYLELPVICLIHPKGWEFPYYTIVRSISEEKLTYFHPKELRWEEVALEEFDNWDLGFLLLIEANELSGEQDYSDHLKVQNKKDKRIAIPLIFSLLLVIILWIFSGSNILPSQIWGPSHNVCK